MPCSRHGYFQDGAGRIKPAAFNYVSNTPSADGTGWTYSGVAPLTNDNLVIVHQCAPQRGANVVIQTGFPVTSPNSGDGVNGTVSGYSTCPIGSTAIAGGHYISNPDGTEATPANVTYSVATNHGPGGVNSWFVQGTAAVGKKVVALVQCLAF